MSDQKPWEWLQKAADKIEAMADAATELTAQKTWTGSHGSDWANHMSPVVGPLLAEMLRGEAGMLRAEVVTGGSMDTPLMEEFVKRNHGAAIRFSCWILGDAK